MNHYTYRIEWSPATVSYVATCLEMSWLTHWAPTRQEAVAGLDAAVAELVAERETADVGMPEPLTEHQYSGKFVVRTSVALHARLAVEAAEQRVSMNQWVVQKLVNRPVADVLDW